MSYIAHHYTGKAEDGLAMFPLINLFFELLLSKWICNVSFLLKMSFNEVSSSKEEKSKSIISLF